MDLISRWYFDARIRLTSTDGCSRRHYFKPVHVWVKTEALSRRLSFGLRRSGVDLSREGYGKKEKEEEKRRSQFKMQKAKSKKQNAKCKCKCKYKRFNVPIFNSGMYITLHYITLYSFDNVHPWVSLVQRGCGRTLGQHHDT